MMRTSLKACLFMLLLSVGAHAQQFFRNGIAYQVLYTAEPLTVEVVSSVNPYFGIIEIPYEVPFNGEIYTVTAIADGAFQYCSGVTTVILPYSITSIGDYAFSGCSSLESITLPMSLFRLGQGAFSGSGLTSIVIPASVMQIGPGAFAGCTSLTNLVVAPGNMKYASVNNLLLSSDLSQLMCVPAGLSGTILVYNTVKQIDYQAFGNCELITAVVIPSSVQKIGPWAFQNCYALKIVELNDGLLTISAGAFEDCQALDTLVLPATLQMLGSNALEDCKSLQLLVLNQGLTQIGGRAFEGCQLLQTLEVPSTVVRVGDNFIKDCSHLASITFQSIVPPVIGTNSFERNQRNLPVYVPSGSRALYREADHWNKLTNITPQK